MAAALKGHGFFCDTKNYCFRKFNIRNIIERSKNYGVNSNFLCCWKNPRQLLLQFLKLQFNVPVQYMCTTCPHISGKFWAFAKSCIFCPFLRTTVCLWHECRTRFKGRGRFFLKKSALQMMINTSFCAIFLNFCHLLFT